MEIRLGDPSMNREQIQRIVVEVISRLVPRLGADGRRGSLIVPFTGATAGFEEALLQVRSLILDGYQIRLAFSQGAEQLCGKVVRNQLEGFPHISSIEPAKWLSALGKAHAVVCPLLSVNTMSKISLLIADNLVTNLILHGLFMGKPVIVARDGVDINGEDRKALGIGNGTPALRKALVNRLETMREYGCCITDVQKLRATVNAILTNEGTSTPKQPNRKSFSVPLRLGSSGRLITAADVRSAHRTGASLSISSASLISPLARDLATQLGVVFVESDGEGSH